VGVLVNVYCTLTEVFPCFFLSCKVKLAKTGHGPHSSTLVCICVVRLLFVLFYVLFVCRCVLPPGDNPTAVNKYINTHMHTSTLASVTMLYCRRLSTFRNLFLSIHEATCHKAKP